MVSNQKNGGGKAASNSSPPSLWRTVITSGAVITFGLGLVVTVFNKLFFFGLDIEQIRQPPIGTQFLVYRGEPGHPVFCLGVVLRVTNNTKEAITIKKLAADPVESRGIRFNFLSSQVVKEGEKMPERREAFRPRSGPVDADLPVQVRSDSQQFISVTYYFDVKGPSAKTEKELYDAFQAYGLGHGVIGGVSIDGKYRDYPLELH